MARTVVHLVGTDHHLVGTTLEGGAGNDILLGGLNDDILIGGAGADFLNGGLGTDTADYSGSSAGVTVNLTTGKGFGGDAQGDTLLSIENVVGSAYADTLIGNNGNNVLTGGAGADTFVLTKGNDVITDFKPEGPPGPDVVVDFEGLGASTYNPLWVPDGYKGLDWTNFLVFDNPTILGVALNSGTGIATNWYAQPVSFTSPNGDIDLESGFFANTFNFPGTFAVEAWDDGVLVGKATLGLGATKTFIDFLAGTAPSAISADFTGRFTSIDEVRFNVSITFEVDDLQFRMAGGDSDRIDVPVGTDIAALVASAVTDGHGGTLLTYQGGQLDLLGIAPASVSANWFI